MAPRYLVCDGYGCLDSYLLGELPCEPMKNTEYIIKDSHTEEINHTGKTICEISEMFDQNVDLKLTLDDKTVVYIIIL